MRASGNVLSLNARGRTSRTVDGARTGRTDNGDGHRGAPAGTGTEPALSATGAPDSSNTCAPAVRGAGTGSRREQAWR